MQCIIIALCNLTKIPTDSGFDQLYPWNNEFPKNCWFTIAHGRINVLNSVKNIKISLLEFYDW